MAGKYLILTFCCIRYCLTLLFFKFDTQCVLNLIFKFAKCNYLNLNSCHISIRDHRKYCDRSSLLYY